MSSSDPEFVPCLDDVPRPTLKRSASLASLPTPPRTRRRRGGGRRGDESSSEEEVDLRVDSDDEEEQRGRYKRRKVQEAEEEESFWGGGRKAEERGRPLVYRRLQMARSKKVESTSTATTSTAPAPKPVVTKMIAPVSPPPSHRKPPPPVIKEVEEEEISLPSTPKPKAKPLFPLRDSPSNPFLETPEDETKQGKDVSPSASEESPGGPKTPGEKPFVTYVFRGTRRTYINPYFNPTTGRAYSPPPASHLPADHPDFEPNERCGPRVLFAKRKGRSRAQSPSLSDDEEEEVLPKKLDFGRGRGTLKRGKEEGERAEKGEKRKRIRTLLEEMGGVDVQSMGGEKERKDLEDLLV